MGKNRRKPVRQPGRYKTYDQRGFNNSSCTDYGNRISGGKPTAGPAVGVLRSYRARAGGISLNLDDPRFEKKFGTPGQRMTLERYKFFQDSDPSVPPRVVLLRTLERRKEFGGDINLHQIVLVDDDKMQFGLYFSGDMAFFLMVEGIIARKSVVYYNTRTQNAREIAQARLRQGMVRWTEFVTLPPRTPAQNSSSPP